MSMQTAGLSTQDDATAGPQPDAAPYHASQAAAGRAAPPHLPLPDVPAQAAMDGNFIARNQIVERYLAGRLPLKGAQDFERYCRQHPELLDEISLTERVHAALRLLEAGGLTPPWETQPKRWWEKLPTLIAAAALALLLAIALLVTASRLSSREHTIASLEHKLSDRALDPAVSTRSVPITPSRVGEPAQSQAAIGGGTTEMAELKIDMSWTQYAIYRVIIDRVDQGRVGTIYNAIRDSSGVLHLGLNSSALGPGDYLLSIQGLTWRGDPVPIAWTRITVAH
jgi:hypothetical protein